MWRNRFVSGQRPANQSRTPPLVRGVLFLPWGIIICNCTGRRRSRRSRCRRRRPCSSTPPARRRGSSSTAPPRTRQPPPWASRRGRPRISSRRAPGRASARRPCTRARSGAGSTAASAAAAVAAPSAPASTRWARSPAAYDDATRAGDERSYALTANAQVQTRHRVHGQIFLALFFLSPLICLRCIVYRGRGRVSFFLLLHLSL